MQQMWVVLWEKYWGQSPLPERGMVNGSWEKSGRIAWRRGPLNCARARWLTTAKVSEALNAHDCSKVLLGLSRVDHLITTKRILLFTPSTDWWNRSIELLNVTCQKPHSEVCDSDPSRFCTFCQFSVASPAHLSGRQGWGRTLQRKEF